MGRSIRASLSENLNQGSHFDGLLFLLLQILYNRAIIGVYSYEIISICELNGLQFSSQILFRILKNVIIGDEKGGDDDEDSTPQPYSV